MKNILVPIHDDTGQEARLQAAFDVVRAFDGHLYCLDIVLNRPIVDNGFMGIGQGMLLASEISREDHNMATVDQRLKTEGLPFTWADAVGDFVHSIARHSDLIDLIVINAQARDWYGGDLHLPARLSLRSDIPVLAVPPTVRPLDLAGPAMVAWDGSPPCNAALRASLPLLALASDVLVVEIVGNRAETSVADVGSYLARHGIGARVKPIVARRGKADVWLLAEIDALRPGYCVMGAYGNSPLRERLFGGVTESMLARSPVPLFLAH